MFETVLLVGFAVIAAGVVYKTAQVMLDWWRWR